MRHRVAPLSRWLREFPEERVTPEFHVLHKTVLAHLGCAVLGRTVGQSAILPNRSISVGWPQGIALMMAILAYNLSQLKARS